MEVSGRKVTGNISKYFFLGSEEDIPLFCEPCDRDGPRVPAHGFCKNCAEYLCESCYKIHRKPTPCKKHILLDKTQMLQIPCRKIVPLENSLKPRTLGQNVLPVPNDLTEPCQLHPGKFIDYYCCDHKILGCSPCITINHRNCNVNYIPEVSKNYYSNPEYLHLMQSLTALKDSCKKITDHANTHKVRIQKNQESIQKGVKKFRQEINVMLDRWEADTNQQSYSLFADENARTDSLVSASNKLMTDIDKLQEKFKTLEKEKKNNALHVQVKTKGRLVKQYTAIVNQMQEKTAENHYTFEPSLAIQKMLKLVTNFGKINIQTSKGCQLQSPMHKEYLKKLHNRLFRNKRKGLQPIEEEIIEENAVHEEIKVEDTELYAEDDNSKNVPESKSIEGNSEIIDKGEGQEEQHHERLLAMPSGELCVRTPNDKVRCRNKAIAIVEKDKIAVVDSENLAIKLIDTKQDVSIYDRELSSRPNGVTVLSKDLLAVALPEESTILFLCISNRLSEAYHLKVDGRCTDLAYCSGKLIVTYQNPGKVEIMDEKGQIFRRIQQNIHGASLYDDSRVTIGVDNKSFYISDRFFKNVKCFNWNGELIGEYNNQQLIRPCGLAALEDGSLLVCNSSNDSIHLISPNLQQDRIMLKREDGLKHPWSIAVDREQNKLYVGSVDTSDHISIYDLNV
ncbi:E3 ubiquitin-protein ligase TRIM71-like [Mercenaria mercenaria]|uniref:E3 ubiquitin-protein ligase TRIM71-like n=1 Tax=Mercenaria mercenaria TaxID=6596 RepID=UPI00234F7691|nr:E3 ubiquitin-protein ligase TRIM71-like [Mercenaria mercenaria]